MKVQVDQDLCIGCGTCELMCGQCFRIEDGKAEVIRDNCDGVECDMQDVIDSCPTEAISFVSEDESVGDKSVK